MQTAVNIGSLTYDTSVIRALQYTLLLKKKTKNNSASIASNKYAKPAQSKKAMNIQQQQFTLEIA